MKNEDLVKILYHLAQLDIDAVHAYNQALENITDEAIHKNITNFRNDHIRHIDDLSKQIHQHNGEPPIRTKDFKGYLIEGFTSLRSITGTEGALKAMEFNEVLTNKTYKEALEENNDLPIEIRALIQRNYADEKRHLEYIRAILANYDKKAS
jgi:uncharacterized protein (TIGR02284 family)